MSPTSSHPSAPPAHEPAWDVAKLFPNQGDWSERNTSTFAATAWLNFPTASSRLERPSAAHQRIMLFLYRALFNFVTAGRLGEVLVAPFPVRLWNGRMREPDVVLMLAENAGRKEDQCWNGADLAVEVLSEDRRRDLETKRRRVRPGGDS